MVQKDLKSFGNTLRQLRQDAGLYQDKLVEKLSLIHAKIEPETDLRLDGNRISKWERAFKSKDGREWRPKRQHVLYLIELFADQLTLDTARIWALQAGYRLDRDELQGIFNAQQTPVSIPPPALPDLDTGLKRLDTLPDQQLFGVDRQSGQLKLVLERDDEPWLAVVDGMGGIGKTSLAAAVARKMMSTDRFHYVAWISAKQEEFLPGLGLQKTNRPALDAGTLIDNLLEQLDQRILLTRSAGEKLAALTRLLKQSSYLIVVDNLENAVDYQTLLPLLNQLANPSKILLTSRHTLYDHAEVFCLSLTGLSRLDTLAFLRHEAGVRGVFELAETTSDGILESIYEVVGGNPLALKLVIGQIRALPLPQVLASLKEAQGKKVDAMYTYIYWQAWQTLSPAGREVLLSMPLVQGGTFTQLAGLSNLTIDALNQAVEQLVQLSLVEVSGDVHQRRYHIHRLTESFLLTEVVKWQAHP